MVDLQVGGNPPPPDLKLCQGKMLGVSCGEQIKAGQPKNCFTKPLPQVLPAYHSEQSQEKKSDKSQLATFDSVKPKRPPAHAFVGSTVGHFPGTEANDVAVVALFVDEKMFRGAENLVNSFVAVFAAVGHTFKRSKNFSDHIFYK